MKKIKTNLLLLLLFTYSVECSDDAILQNNKHFESHIYKTLSSKKNLESITIYEDNIIFSYNTTEAISITIRDCKYVVYYFGNPAFDNHNLKFDKTFYLQSYMSEWFFNYIKDKFKSNYLL